MNTNCYVVRSLEMHLFFGRIMKEHALFLRAGFTPADPSFSQKAEFYLKEFESLLCEAVSLSDGIVGKEFLGSGEVITEFTSLAEKQTECAAPIEHLKIVVTHRIIHHIFGEFQIFLTGPAFHFIAFFAARWMIANLEYGYNYNAIFQYFDVRKTLRTKQGVCFDFSHLFAALCRSQNIPCYAVDGISFKDSTVQHTWNRVYYDGFWWNMDVTHDITGTAEGKDLYGFRKLGGAFAPDEDFFITKIY